MSTDAEQESGPKQAPDQARLPLYRPQALERSGRVEPIDGLLRVTAPHEWIILAAVAAALCIAAVWGAAATVERGVTAPCVAARPGERHPATAPSAGIVADVMVSGGDRVEAGQLLARLSNPALATPVALARSRLAALTAGAADARDQAAVRAELSELERSWSSGIAVRSPVDGMVATVAAAPGSRVDAGAEVASVRSGDGRGIVAIAALDAAGAGEVRPGMTARVSLNQTASAHARVATAEVVATASPSDAAGSGLGARRAALGGTEWVFAARLQGAPAAPYRAVLVFDDHVPPMANDGDACTARITISRGSPLQLLWGRADR